LDYDNKKGCGDIINSLLGIWDLLLSNYAVPSRPEALNIGKMAVTKHMYGSEGKFLSIEGNREIYIVSFLCYI
jgi:hypothetical protein